jgi:hypothetical protein
LLEHWQTAGGEPWTVRQVTETLGKMDWSDATARESWLLVRTWLRERPDIVRVGLGLLVASPKPASAT